MEEENYAPQYPSHTPDNEPYAEDAAGRPLAQYPDGYPVAEYQAAQYQDAEYLAKNLVRSSYLQRSVPQFLINRDDIPDPGEYLPALRDRASYYASRILAGAFGGIALAALAALASSQSAQDFLAGAKASGVAALSVASVVMQPNSAPSKVLAAEPDQSGASSVVGSAPVPATVAAEGVVAPGPGPGIAGSGNAASASVMVAAVTPTRDDIRAVYQDAVQGSTPPVAAAPATAAPADVIRHLDAGEIASLLKRADALVTSGDLAAARLVLRRAAEAGDARAAMMLGGTYDPTVLGKFGVYGLVPDPAMARSWYEKAKRLGAPQTSQLDLPAKRQD